MKILRINHSSEESHIYDIFYFDMKNFISMHSQNYEKIIDFETFEGQKIDFTKPCELEIYKWASFEVKFNLLGEIKIIEGMCRRLHIPEFERFMLNDEINFYTIHLRQDADLEEMMGNTEE